MQYYADALNMHLKAWAMRETFVDEFDRRTNQGWKLNLITFTYYHP
jgi:hypothetical protein